MRHVPCVAVLVALLAGCNEPVPAEKAGCPPWPPADAVFSRSVMCKPEKLKTIAPVHIDATHWGMAVYPGQVGTKSRENILKRIDMVHAAGAKYMGSINGRGFYHKSMDSEAVRMLDGKPLLYPAMNNAVFKCSLNPKMFDAFVSTAKRCVDMGMDGFILDSWSAEGKSLCFCEHCLRFYRDCLRKHRDDPRFKELAGVDPDTFDYGEYLRGKGVSGPEKYWSFPCGPAFQDYRYRELVTQKRRFWRTIRAYADAHAAKAFYLTANVYSMGSTTFAVHDLLDYFNVEFPYFGSFDGYPPQCTSIALHKKGRMAGKRCMCQPGCHDTARALIGKPSIVNLFKVWIAEAYACGNIFEMIPQEFAGYENGKVIHLDIPVEKLAPYYAFIQAHPEIYTETTSPARIAVLYSMAAAEPSSASFEKEYQAVCKLLHDAHVQFDVLLVGDGEWNNTMPTAGELKRYQGLIAIRPQLYRKETVDRLLAYRESGGRMILCGAFRDSEEPYSRLCKAVCGKEVPPKDLRSFSSYIKTRDGSVRADVLKAIGPDPVLWADAPADVGIVVSQVGKRTIIHLVNYGYDQQTDQVKPVKDIELRLTGKASKARLLSPDGDGDVKLNPGQARDGVRLTIPELRIYSIIVVDET